MDQGEAIVIAQKYLSLLETRYNIRGAFLFGSYARNANHEDSDIDIAILLEEGGDLIDTQAELLQLRRKVDLRIEPHPFESSDFNENNPVVSEILKYGITIPYKHQYARTSAPFM